MLNINISFLLGALSVIFVHFFIVSLSSIKHFLLSPSSSDNYGTSHKLLNLNLKSSASWLSMGYWTNTTNFVEACSALADMVYSSCSDGDRILDCGIGCGDQIVHLLNTKSPSMVVGVTSELKQCKIAKNRLENTITKTDTTIYLGDACSDMNRWQKLTGSSSLTEMEEFDVVTCIDALYHMDRAKFFSLSHDRLAKAGKLSLTDIILSDSPISPRTRFILQLICKFTQVPNNNLLVTRKEYLKTVENAGFTNIIIDDITENVFSGLAGHIERQTRLFKTGFGTNETSQEETPFAWNKYEYGVHWLANWLADGQKLRFIVVKAQKADK